MLGMVRIPRNPAAKMTAAARRRKVRMAIGKVDLATL
jgi:hypothetical protein